MHLLFDKDQTQQSAYHTEWQSRNIRRELWHYFTLVLCVARSSDFLEQSLLTFVFFSAFLYPDPWSLILNPRSWFSRKPHTMWYSLCSLWTQRAWLVVKIEEAVVAAFSLTKRIPYGLGSFVLPLPQILLSLWDWSTALECCYQCSWNTSKKTGKGQVNHEFRLSSYNSKVTGDHIFFFSFQLTGSAYMETSKLIRSLLVTPRTK